MANLPPTADELEYGYCFYHPEGGGYLHMQRLGSGTEAVADLVWSCANNSDQNADKVYVRKKTFADRISNRLRAPNASDQHARAEILFYRSHPLIPSLIDWTYYRPLRHSHPQFRQYESSSMIFQYCNSGNLSQLMNNYIEMRVDAHRTLTNCRRGSDYCAIFHLDSEDNLGVLVPEAFVWHIFGQLLGIMNFLHQARPGIFHFDGVASNIFFHRDSEDQTLPDCYLGDFGKSSFMAHYTTWDAAGKVLNAGQADPNVSDFENVLRIAKQLMTLTRVSTLRPDRATWDDDRMQAAFDKIEERDIPNPYWRYSRDAAFDTTAGGSPANYDWYDIRDPGPEEWQESNRQSGPFYSPRLYATIRQFEDRIEDIRYNKTKPDWNYLAQAIKAEASKYMTRDNMANKSVCYPMIDACWDKTLQGSKYAQYRPASSFQLAVYSWEQLFQLPTDTLPAGPWKIARIDRRTLEVLSISRRAYRSYWPHAPIFEIESRGHERRSSSVSVPRSIRETDTLNVGISGPVVRMPTAPLVTTWGYTNSP